MGILMQMLEEADIPDPSARKGLSSILSVVVVVIFVVVCPAEVVTGSSLARSLLSVLTRLAFIGRERERKGEREACYLFFNLSIHMKLVVVKAMSVDIQRGL